MDGCGSEKDLSEVINIRGVPVPLICLEFINDAEKAANCYALRSASKQDIELLADRLEQATSSLREIAGYGYYD